jgi:CheY-like chemotaxis protein
MNIRSWTVCLIEPNKYEGQIIVELLRMADVDKIKTFTDSNAAMDALELYPANIIIGAVEMTPIDGPTWTRAFRRNAALLDRKAPIFLTSRAFSRSIAEDCRHAGANALIGKPVSGKILTATIQKVLANPRPFIDAPGYVGPCRRAGIVTAGAGSRRRKSDDSQPARAAEAPTLASLVAALSKAVADLVQGKGAADACDAALKPVQALAVKGGDGPMTRACEVFALQLAAKNAGAEAGKAALSACVAGMAELAQLAATETQKREAIAESVREQVAKAAARKAA